MPRCRVVQPTSKRIDLSDGDWIEVKRRLCHGDVRDRMVALTGIDLGNGRAELNRDMVGIADILAWVVAWSFIDTQGVILPIEKAAIRQLDDESYREIVDAVDLHEVRMDVEVAEEKKSRVGEKPSTSTSTSAGSPA